MMREWKQCRMMMRMRMRKRRQISMTNTRNRNEKEKRKEDKNNTEFVENNTKLKACRERSEMKSMTQERNMMMKKDDERI